MRFHYTSEEYTMNQISKKDKVRHHLETGKSITPEEAYSLYGSMRLASIVHDLKGDGYKFKTEIINQNNKGQKVKYARYSLEVPETLFPDN
tara:strand:+ start:771 stop:1043 length:273 start_codon:yes stop_codon:yes gene_type:complete